MKHTLRKTRLAVRLLLFFLACGITAGASAQTRTIRVVTYNIQDDVGATAPLPGLIAPSSGGSVTNGGVLEGIGEEILAGNNQPIDVLALQETTNATLTVQPILDGLNAFYSSRSMSPRYAMSSLVLTTTGGSGGGPNAMVYNTNTLQLVASVAVGVSSVSGAPRQVGRYLFAPAGVATNASNTFYVYVSHAKSGTGSSNANRRAIEAGIIRTNSALLASDSRVLYVGDFNDSNSSEQMYQIMVGTGIGIPGFDPLNPSGTAGLNWGTSTTDTNILKMLSESATNLRFRDDYQMMSSNVLYGVGGGLTLVPGTYHVFGCNGTTVYNGTVNSASNTSLNNLNTNGVGITAAQLRQYLTTASDHLPVVADYTIQTSNVAPVANFTGSPTNGTAPLLVAFTDSSTGSITNRFWNFGDGNTTNLTTATVSHTYTANTYSVTLIVTGPGGAGTNTQSNYITATLPPALAVTPATGVSVAGEQGGPFSPGSQAYALSNTGGSNLSWTAGVSNNWLSLSATSGSLSPGASTNVMVSTNANTVALPGGLYSNLVSFVNSTNGAGNTNLVWTLLVRDGIPDEWRLLYFGHIDPSDSDLSRAQNDPDGDGFTNLQEFLAGTDPTDSASALRITSIVLEGVSVRIEWTMGPGRTNALQATSGDAGGEFATNGFSNLFIVTNTVGSVTNYLDIGAATNVPARYYRVRVVP